MWPTEANGLAPISVLAMLASYRYYWQVFFSDKWSRHSFCLLCPFFLCSRPEKKTCHYTTTHQLASTLANYILQTLVLTGFQTCCFPSSCCCLAALSMRQHLHKAHHTYRQFHVHMQAPASASELVFFYTCAYFERLSSRWPPQLYWLYVVATLLHGSLKWPWSGLDIFCKSCGTLPLFIFACMSPNVE